MTFNSPSSKSIYKMLLCPICFWNEDLGMILYKRRNCLEDMLKLISDGSLLVSGSFLFPLELLLQSSTELYSP